MEGHGVKARTRTRGRALRSVQLVAALAVAAAFTAPAHISASHLGGAVHAAGPIGGSTAIGAQLNHFAGGRQPPPPPSPV